MVGCSQMEEKIVFEGIFKEFSKGQRRILAVKDFNLSVREHEFLVLVGPSGCGKSTVLHMAAGLVSPSQGRVLLDGRPITGPGPDRGVVFQQFALFPWKTVYENIEFGLKYQDRSPKERKEIVESYLRLMGLEEFAHSYPHELSGGMKQRVAIARSYAINPSVLLMDEPFAALDAQTRIVMQEELIKLWKRDKPTVIFITHSVDEAVYLGDRVVVMTKRPGTSKCVIPITGSTGTGDWREQPIDDVMASPRFSELKVEIWRLVRAEMDASQDTKNH